MPKMGLRKSFSLHNHPVGLCKLPEASVGSLHFLHQLIKDERQGKLLLVHCSHCPLSLWLNNTHTNTHTLTWFI